MVCDQNKRNHPPRPTLLSLRDGARSRAPIRAAVHARAPHGVGAARADLWISLSSTPGLKVTQLTLDFWILELNPPGVESAAAAAPVSIIKKKVHTT